MQIFQRAVAIVDTETTGLPKHEWASVIEIGAVLIDTHGQLIDIFSRFVLPTTLDERADEAMAINQIDIKKVLAHGGKPWAVAWEFEKWLRGHGFPMMATFGIDFDREMLRRMRFGYGDWDDCIQASSKADMVAAGIEPWIDRSWPQPRLSEAAAFYGVVQEEPAHRALSDARTAARIMVAIQKRRMGA